MAAPSPALGELVAEGKLADAARAFAAFPFNDDEIAQLEDVGYLAAAERYVPNLLNHFDARMQEIPGAAHAAPLTHPEALAEALTEFFAAAQQPA